MESFRYQYIYGIYVFILSCNSQPEKITEPRTQSETEPKTVFYTQDSLYKVSFVKPLELDTFYSWISYNDNNCSEEHRYRFSKKEFPITKESGWFQLPIADSTYTFTLSHVLNYNCKSQTEKLNDNEPTLYLKNEYKKCIEKGWSVDTFFSKRLKVHKRDFIIYAYRANEQNRNKYYRNYLKAFTVIDNNILDFKCECWAKDCENFIESMEKAINSIKVEKFK